MSQAWRHREGKDSSTEVANSVRTASGSDRILEKLEKQFGTNNPQLRELSGRSGRYRSRF